MSTDQVSYTDRLGATISAALVVNDAPAAWDPSQLGFVPRPTGAGYVAIESLGVTLDGPGLRKAAVHPSAAGKVLTLPAAVFAFTDFVQGDGAQFMHGLMVNSDIAGPHIRGIVGSGAGTVIQMVPNSSHWKTEAAAEQGGTSTGAKQVTCSIIQFFKIANVEFGNLVVQGQKQPHYHHGIRINGDNAHVHHVKFQGANQGGNNSPPGETYSLLMSGKNPVAEDCEYDGRRMLPGDTAPVSSSPLIFVGGPAIASRSFSHDMLTGFGIVLWEDTGLTDTDFWVSRPGTGPGGLNGAHTNHEMSAGHIVHNRPNILLDGAWTNPIIGGVKKFPTKPPARNQGKFPHMIFLTTTDGPAKINPNATADVHIIEPVFDPWGGVGGFAIGQDDQITSFPEVILNGVKLTPVRRPNWWVDVPGFDPKKNYWVASTTPGNGSVWG